MTTTFAKSDAPSGLESILAGTEPANPNYQERVRDIFARAAFVEALGVRLTGCGQGWCEAELNIEPRHLQQDDFVHAGVLSTLADHTAGAAAATMINAERIVLTVEFKINLLRPALGDSLRCRAELLKCGRRLIIAESSIFSRAGGKEKLVAKATVTLAPV